MKITITNGEADDIVVHTRDGAYLVTAGKSVEFESVTDAGVLLLHRDHVRNRSMHGFADSLGIASHHSGGSPYPVEERMRQATEKVHRAVQGE